MNQPTSRLLYGQPAALRLSAPLTATLSTSSTGANIAPPLKSANSQPTPKLSANPNPRNEYQRLPPRLHPQRQTG